mgnify:CR=1 FL=1
MVALKRGNPWRWRAGPPPKQERRGGIETVMGWFSKLHLGEKQERRGGIETVQEDLGDDETGVKQERRGGIETRIWYGRSRRSRSEAGTPWWH